MNRNNTDCVKGSFLPVTLEQLARERGVLWSDKTTSCMAKAAAESNNAAGATMAALFKRAQDRNDNQCVIRPFGFEITTASFAMYTFSLAVLVQALALVSFSSVADHGTQSRAQVRSLLTLPGNYRKKLLVIFGYTGATTSMLFLFVFPEIYLLAPILVIIGVTCLGSSFVLLNSFLPLLVLNHSQAQVPAIALQSLSSDRRDSVEAVAVFPGPDIQNSDSTDLKLSSQISSKGVGIGYAAAVFVQILSIVILFLMSKTSVSSTFPLRMVLFLVGLWWFAFTIPSSMWLRTRPGPPLQTTSHLSKWRSFLAYGSFAWLSLWKTIKVAAKLKQMFIFLIAWFLLSDAVATISGTAILFARTELRMGTVPIALLSITATASGIAGAYCWPILSRKFGLQTNRTIVACILLMEIIPLYGLMGYIPFIQAWGVGGLQQAWEIYPLGFVHGFVMGGLSSYCRSFYGLLIPPGSEAAFYALYAITDKGSSAVGPAIVGVIVDRTGSIRPAFFFLAILIALPGPLIWMVDAKQGQEDAAWMAGMLKKLGPSDDEVDANEESRFQESEGLMRDHD